MSRQRSDPKETFPRSFGKYELLERIGEGGMAEVFRARLPGKAGFEKIVVIKRILPHLASRKQVVDMFLAEARLTAQVQHKNIVQVFELGEDEETGDPFMVMEHISGADLRRLLKSAVKERLRVPPWFSVHVIAEVLDGLAYAHELTDDRGRPRNIVHRDVTPSNIFVSFLGDTKLGDFGIAKEKQQSSLTRTGQLKGKVAYMSPEQLYGEEIDERADVFACGIVLWECLAQKRLFGGRPDVGAMKMICEAPRIPPSQIFPDVPPALDACVLEALEIERDKRTKTSREMQSRLLEIQHQLHPITKPQEVRQTVEIALGRREATPEFRLLDVHSLSEGFLSETDDEDREEQVDEHPRELPPSPVRRKMNPTEMELSFEQSRLLGAKRRTMPVAADLPPFRDEEDDTATDAAEGPPASKPSPPEASDDDPASWLMGADEVHAEANRRLQEFAQQRWQGYGELENVRYDGPHPFWLRDKQQRTIGPYSLENVIALIKAESSNRLGPDAHISVDRGQHVLDLAAFAKLTGQETLFFDPNTRVPTTAELIGYLDQESMVHVATTIARERLTGRLSLAPESRKPLYREIHFIRGAPTYVFANEESLQLPEVLVARLLLPKDLVPDAVRRSIAGRAPLDEVAAALSVQGTAQIASAAAKIRTIWMKDRLVEMFRWTTGRFSFETSFVPQPVPSFARSLFGLLPELVHRALTPDDLKAALLLVKDAKLELAPRPEVSMDELGLSPTQREVVQWIAKGKKLPAILKAHPKEERLVLLVTYILLESGLLFRT
jgi:serine/threonine protein kinase